MERRFRNEFGMTAWVRNDSIKVKNTTLVMPNLFRHLKKVEYKSNYRFRNEFGMTAWGRNESMNSE